MNNEEILNVRFTLNLTPTMDKSIKVLSEKKGLSRSELIREAVDLYLTANRRKSSGFVYPIDPKSNPDISKQNSSHSTKDRADEKMVSLFFTIPASLLERVGNE